MDILVTEKNYQHTFEENLIQDVIDFVNSLFGAEYLDTEIPAEALEIYYVDFYRYHSESDDGIANMLAKSSWRARIMHSILNGLQKIGAPKNRALFLKLIDGVAVEMEKLKIDDTAAYMRSHEFENNSKIMALIEEFNAGQNRIQKDEDLIDLLHAHIKTLPNLRVLPQEQYASEFKTIMENAPDQEARRAKSYQEALENERTDQKEIRRACASIDEYVTRWNAVTFERYDDEKGVASLNAIDLDKTDEDGLIPVWFYLTDKGLRSTVFYNGKTIVFDMDNLKELLRVDSADGFKPWQE